MVEDLTPEALEEASKLFEAAANLEESQRKAKKQAETVAKIVEAKKAADLKHRDKLKRAMGRKHDADAAVRVAQQAKDTIRDRFVDRELILELEQRQAAWRKAQGRIRRSEEVERSFRASIETCKRDKGMHREFRVKRISELERQIVHQESATAGFREDLEAAAAKCKETEGKIAEQIEAIYQLSKGAGANA